MTSTPTGNAYATKPLDEEAFAKAHFFEANGGDWADIV